MFNSKQYELRLEDDTLNVDRLPMIQGRRAVVTAARLRMQPNRYYQFTWEDIYKVLPQSDSDEDCD